MKRQLYDLTDEAFAVFVNRIGSVLRDENVTHNIVGGTASQAYILDLMTKKYGRNIVDLTADPDVRIQDYVRSTDDIDIALGLNGEDVDKIRLITNDILPRLNFEEISPDEESIIEYKSERIGASRPRFRVYTNGQGSQDDVIAMNLSRGQNGDLYKLDDSLYKEFLEQGRDIEIPFADDYSINLRVPRLEHLLASKISQSRAKDLMDNKNIAALVKKSGIKIDFGEMDRILLPEHEDNYTHFLSTEFPERV